MTAVVSPPEARRRVRELLAIGDPAGYGPVSVERSGVRRRGGIAMERLDIGSSDGDRIPCLLLAPAGPASASIIALHQHAGAFDLGKSEPAGLAGDPALAYGLRLAERGARVLIPDLLGFEDRHRGWSANAGADERRDARSRVARGSSLQAKHTRDVATLTTWLIGAFGGDLGVGVVGHSLGGQVALFSLAVDARLSVGVVSCGAGTLASFAAERIAHNPAWFVPGLEAAGDVPLLAAALHGQRVLVSAGTRDPLFPLDGVREVIAAFGPDVCTAELFEGRHALPPASMRLALDLLVPAG